jgi:retron-type reverse transcriptase
MNLYLGQIRSYVTRSRDEGLEPVQELIADKQKGLLFLAKHWKTCLENQNRIFYDLRGLLKQEALWIAAYKKLSGNKGATTPGPDGLNINSLNFRKVLQLRNAVLQNKFTWLGTREVMIDKPGKPGGIKRPLDIPTINDRLVQEVLRSIIEPIFEFQFLNSSHGFRHG